MEMMPGHEKLIGLQIALFGIVAISGILVNLTRNAKPEELQQLSDSGTLRIFRILYPLGNLASFWAQFWKPASLEDFVPYNFLLMSGLILYAGGLILRWIAILTLKNAFTVKISILQNHKLKTTGVYRWLRHPSYTGLLLYYTGLGLIMANVISLLLLWVVNLAAILPRIRKEEEVLSLHFGDEWQQYARKTPGLFPFF